MITVIALGYCVLVYLAFRVIKIKVSPISLAAAGLIGVFTLTGIVVAWKMSAPMSGQVFVRRRILTVIPDVEEFVSKVHVKTNQMVNKGDALYDITPDRFQDAVDQASAELEAAKSAVSQMEADVMAAKATINQQTAETAAAKAEFDSALDLQKTDTRAISKLKVGETEQQYLAEQATGKVVAARLKQATFSLAAAKTSVDVAQASYDLAKFNRERCTYTSTVDGQVMNFQITEGTPANRLRALAIGSVQDLSETAVIAIFPQNLLKNVKAGDVAEMTFKRRPGQIVKGKVELVVKYTGEGHILPSLIVPIAADVKSEGYLGVKIRLDNDELAKQLPLGAAGTVAIYTDSGKPWHIISKIAVRMKSWMYYAPL